MAIRWFFNFSSSLTTGYAIPLSATLGAVVILILGVILVTGVSVDRSQNAMVQVLAEKGEALVNAVEGTVRIGKWPYSGVRLQSMLEELAKRRDINFVAVTTPEGIILAHNNVNRFGSRLVVSDYQEFSQEALEALNPSETYGWKMMKLEGKDSFVVYKVFHPQDKALLGFVGVPAFIFVGLDPEPLEIAQEDDNERALFVGSGVLVVGILVLSGLHIFGHIQGFRQQQRAAEALAEGLALTLPDGLIVFDSLGNITRMNMAAVQLLGIKAISSDGWQTYEDKNNNEVLPQELTGLIKDLVENGSLGDTEVTLFKEDGEISYVSVRGGHVGYHPERWVGFLLFLQDITAVRILEAEILRKEKLAAVGSLAAGVAHEIRNPLSSVKGYASYFGERFPEGSPDKEAARVMVQEVERVNRAVSDLISLSLPTDLRLQKTDLCQVLQDVLRLIDQDAKGRSVNLMLDDKDKSFPLTYIDPDRIRQVLLNLCLNALEAMPYGGMLTLGVHFDHQLQSFSIEVKDTGIGIDGASLPRIFDPYYTTKTSGTGLGLATVHKIVEAHKGMITVSSEINKGTIFQLTFPFVPIFT